MSVTTQTHQFLDELGVQEFINVFQELSGQQFQDSVVDTLDSDAAPDKMLSAKGTMEIYNTLMNFLTEITREKGNVDRELKLLREYISLDPRTEVASVLTHLTPVFVVGRVESVIPHPDSSTLYFQHDSAEDPAWNLYVYSNSTWICVGRYTAVMDNYWSKEETDTLVQLLQEPITLLTEDEIRVMVLESFDDMITCVTYTFHLEGDQMVLEIPDNESVEMCVEGDELVLEDRGMVIDAIMSRFSFEINDDGILIVTL